MQRSSRRDRSDRSDRPRRASRPDAGASSPEDWVEDHGDFIFRYALHRVGDVAVAEDLTQDTMLAALQRLSSFDGRASLRTWMTSILKNKIADHYRRRAAHGSARQAEPLEAWAEDLFDKRGAWKRKPRRWDDEPTEQEEVTELSSVLERCLRRLPSQVAELFVLSTHRHVPADRLAKAVGVTLNTLSVRLYRARLALRECLTQNWFEKDEA